MECRDAQFYLRFRRPGSDDLGPEVAADLDRHLTGCGHCAAEAGAASAFDTAVAAAMLDVPVPAGLRNKLIAHVAEKRGAALRRKAYRYAGTAAAVFLALGLTFGLFGSRPTFNTYTDLVANFDEQRENPHDAVQKWLAEQKVTALPEPFDPRLFDTTGHDRIKDRYVPYVGFRDPRTQQWARVYVLRRDGPFKLKDLAGFQGSSCQARVYDDEQKFRDVVFVVVFTGRDLEPLLVAKPVNGTQAN
jgi:hypothetical protein